VAVLKMSCISRKVCSYGSNIKGDVATIEKYYDSRKVCTCGCNIKEAFIKEK